jgi:hypothetical protein
VLALPADRSCQNYVIAAASGVATREQINLREGGSLREVDSLHEGDGLKGGPQDMLNTLEAKCP